MMSPHWELRPGGMIVQKRNQGSDQPSLPPPTIRVKVKYGRTYHEISISSQATFGELKKMLSGPTGLPHSDQKLIFKDKERESNAFLDISGVKNKSKIVLIEDPICRERRLLEMRKNAKVDKSLKLISQISSEVDKLEAQVLNLESVINKGQNIAGGDADRLTELLMNQLLKLDDIVADGEVKTQRKVQVHRVQGYVEILDKLKLTNTSNPRRNHNHQRHFGLRKMDAIPEDPANTVGNDPQPQGSSVVVTTRWETFDSVPTSSPQSSASASTVPKEGARFSDFSWDLMD